MVKIIAAGVITFVMSIYVASYVSAQTPTGTSPTPTTASPSPSQVSPTPTGSDLPSGAPKTGFGN